MPFFATAFSQDRTTTFIKWQIRKLISMCPLHKRTRQKHLAPNGTRLISNGMSPPIRTSHCLANGRFNPRRLHLLQQQRLSQGLRLHQARPLHLPKTPAQVSSPKQRIKILSPMTVMRRLGINTCFTRYQSVHLPNGMQ